MLIEVLAILFTTSISFLFFGHLKDAGLAFIAGGLFLTITGALVALDGVDVITQKVESTNYTAPFAWGYNTTYNFSYFTPSNTTKSTTYVFTDVAKSPTLPAYAHNTIWLLVSFLGVFYIITGGVVLYQKPDKAR